MKELAGNIWDFHPATIIAITTNGQVSRAGRLVMGRGVAAQAALRYPDLPDVFGALVAAQGNHVQFSASHNIVSFPVEHTPFEHPDLRLIERSAEELALLAGEMGWESIIVPRPGCGGGGLLWKDVKPLLERHFDDRFAVITTER